MLGIKRDFVVWFIDGDNDEATYQLYRCLNVDEALTRCREENPGAIIYRVATVYDALFGL